MVQIFPTYGFVKIMLKRCTIQWADLNRVGSRWTELVPVHYKAFHEIPKLPKEYEDVMIRPISSKYKVPEFEIRLNKPYRGVLADDHWPAGGYMVPFYAVFDAGFTY